MIFGTPLYIGAIESLIKDAFPKSNVYVFYDDSPFSPTKYAVKAYVDGYGAYIDLDAFEWSTEELVSKKLISMIKEEMEKKENKK